MSRTILSSLWFIFKQNKISMPSGRPQIPPVRKEQIGAAESTATGRDDVLAPQPPAEKLIEIGQGQIQVPSFELGSGTEKPFRSEMTTHRHIDPTIHFITARSDGRTDSRQNLRRTALKVPFHDLNDLGGNLQRRPSPSCMNRANDSPVGVQKKNRHAVGGSDTEGYFRTLRDAGITDGNGPFTCCGRIFPDHQHIILVYLIQNEKGPYGNIEGTTENAPVFANPLFFVPLPRCHIQRRKGSFTDAALAGAESMGKKSEIQKFAVLQERHRAPSGNLEQGLLLEFCFYPYLPKPKDV